MTTSPLPTGSAASAPCSSGRYGEADHATAEYLRAAGAEVTELRLADLGIRGNGHLMMLERNNDEIAQAITSWLTSR